MKKKILFTAIMAALFVCLLAVAVSAARVEDYDDTYTLQSERSIVHYENWSYNNGKSWVRKGYTDSITATYVDEIGNVLTEVAMWEYDEDEGKYYSLVWYISDYELTWEDQTYTDANVGTQTYPKYTAATYTLSKVRAVDLRYYTYNSNRKCADIESWKENRSLKALEGIYLTNGTPDDTSDDIKLQDAVGIGRDSSDYGYVGYDAQFEATGNKIVVGNFRDCDFECDMEGNYGTANTWSRADNLQCLWYPDTMKHILGGIGPVCEVDFGDGMEIIACQILRDNKNIKEVVIPNSVLYLNNESFRGSDLTKVVIGENLVTCPGNNAYLYTGGADNLYISKNLLKTYTKKISELIANQSANIYFDGNLEEATAIMNRIISENSGYNNKITLVDYNEVTERGDVKNVCLFYNYNRCDAFYAGQHNNAVTYGFANGEIFIGDYCKYEGCARCGEKSTTVIGKLLVNKGYSISESGDGFTYDITFDKDVIAIYEENEGKAFNYGIVAGKITEGDGGKIVTATGEKATDGVFTSLFTETSYELFNVKVTGVDTAEYKAKDVYLSAFVIDGEDVYYLGQEVTDTAVAISYDKIFAIINATGEEE